MATEGSIYDDLEQAPEPEGAMPGTPALRGALDSLRGTMTGQLAGSGGETGCDNFLTQEKKERIFRLMPHYRTVFELVSKAFNKANNKHLKGFGFQIDNQRNQFEHLTMLLANKITRNKQTVPVRSLKPRITLNSWY